MEDTNSKNIKSFHSLLFYQYVDLRKAHMPQDTICQKCGGVYLVEFDDKCDPCLQCNQCENIKKD